MDKKDNYLKTDEPSTKQNTNILDGVLNNAPPSPVPAQKPLDKVKEPPAKKRTREREDR